MKNGTRKWVVEVVSSQVVLSGTLYCSVLYLYLGERRGVQENTSMRSREFLRAQPKGIPGLNMWGFFCMTRGPNCVLCCVVDPIICEIYALPVFEIHNLATLKGGKNNPYVFHKQINKSHGKKYQRAILFSIQGLGTSVSYQCHGLLQNQAKLPP